jgi:cytochrome b561
VSTDSTSLSSRVHSASFPRRATWRQPSLTVALHWLSALCVLLAFAVGWSCEAFDEDAPRAMLMAVHQGAGLIVFALLLARATARFLLGGPAPDASMPRLARLAAAGAHGLMYLLLAAMPLLGWALASAHGHPPHFLGVVPLPALVAVDPDLAETLESWHVGLAWTMAAFIVAHVGAALWHHFVWRDRVLLAMLPEPSTPRPRRTPDFAPNSDFA